MALATKTLSGFTIDLIHRDSSLSPYYKPSLTPSQRISNAALRSIARSKRLQNNDGSPKTITIPDQAITEYLMRFYIGTPPVERFAIADTGSDLIWVQCSPCVKCVPQNTPLYDPTKSSSFKGVKCDSQPCTLLPPNQRFCGNLSQCIYTYVYGDHSMIQGLMGVETISFGSKGNGAIKFPKLTFGCTLFNNDTEDESKKNTGLVGLGVGPLSLISQLGNQIGRKFSYCFVPFESNSTSKMKFGDEAIVKGKGVVSTPLIVKSIGPSYYYLNLEGISIGSKKVKTIINQNDFGNILIDSGTSFTLLKQSFYNKFVTLVKEVYGVEGEKNPPAPFDFCFKNKGSRKSFPEIVFLFTEARVRVNASNLFSAMDKYLLCMWVVPVSEDDDPIFGNHAQVDFQVEYDLQGGKVSFAPTDCAKD
uniref:Aspartic proteinase nepenthesin-2 n=2 Tax=Cajanus cajan TaxID=3821 RepID=A0A151SJX4_CAJCA|nr:Aspartic proteinase nepenthesin-2 [Cajanus cajan]